MAAMDLITPINNPALQPRTTNRSGGGSKEQKPDALVWINVGYTTVDPVTGEDVFVSLPMGIPVDTQDEAKVSGSNESYRFLQDSKNQLLNGLRQFGLGLESGAEQLIPDLQIQIRRVKDKTEIKPGENPMATALQSMSFMRKAG